MQIYTFTRPTQTLLLTFETGTHNGYIAVPREHPWFEVDYSDIDNVQVHGGLTYSGRGLMPEDLQDLCEDYWVLGFDTCHLDDNSINQDEEYVLEELESLKKQAEEACLN